LQHHSFPTRRSSDLSDLKWKRKTAMRFVYMSQLDSKQSKDRIIIFGMNKEKSSAFAELFCCRKRRHYSYAWSNSFRISLSLRPRSEEHTSELQSREN